MNVLKLLPRNVLLLELVLGSKLSDYNFDTCFDSFLFLLKSLSCDRFVITPSFSKRRNAKCLFSLSILSFSFFRQPQFRLAYPVSASDVPLFFFCFLGTGPTELQSPRPISTSLLSRV